MKTVSILNICFAWKLADHNNIWTGLIRYACHRARQQSLCPLYATWPINIYHSTTDIYHHIPREFLLVLPWKIYKKKSTQVDQSNSTYLHWTPHKSNYTTKEPSLQNTITKKYKTRRKQHYGWTNPHKPINILQTTTLLTTPIHLVQINIVPPNHSHPPSTPMVWTVTKGMWAGISTNDTLTLIVRGKQTNKITNITWTGL